MDYLRSQSERYNNMDAHNKEALLQRKGQHYRRNASDLPDVNLPGLASNNVAAKTNLDEFDRAIFEPTHTFEDGEETDMNGGHVLHTDDLYAADNGIVLLQPQDDNYESYGVCAEGAGGHSMTDDPYEVIYQNLPQRHKLRNVPDCRFCGAMRFQYEPPGFCRRKGKVNIHISEVPKELKRLFTSQNTRWRSMEVLLLKIAGTL
ncbi:uncharacterized protein LOC120713707 isoform X2 [Panicum virgatum]|uniref:uncharacterized protein LOC120713707 isoform X2 n=1 Tax=Panicum virgatum TaxID=38727 RepID=UPI0019D5B0F9|nr:uncharacterized protein LOC120713707 isoform X2 [Panicum virgatum]